MVRMGTGMAFLPPVILAKCYGEMDKNQEIRLLFFREAGHSITPRFIKLATDIATGVILQEMCKALCAMATSTS